MAETQTVLWRASWTGPAATTRPVVCVDPRRTAVAEAAHAPAAYTWPRGGHQPGADERPDSASCSTTAGSTTTGSPRTRSASTSCAGPSTPYTPEHVAEICGVDADDVRRAARIFGESERVLSTVLQGFYQSHQATAASVAVNNLHLLRGMIGRPGAGCCR